MRQTLCAALAAHILMSEGGEQAGETERQQPTEPLTPLKIFISYRRTDAEGHAGRLKDSLAREFGNDHVFMDVDRRRRYGEDWLEATISDGTGNLMVMWTGRRRIAGIAAGKRLLVTGRGAPKGKGGRLLITNPRYELL